MNGSNNSKSALNHSLTHITDGSSQLSTTGNVIPSYNQTKDYNLPGLLDKDTYEDLYKWITGAAGYTNDIYYITGNVGIGTTTPAEKFEVHGTSGQLFQVSDDLDDVVFSANNISGLPVIEAKADNTVILGKFGRNDLVVKSDGEVEIKNLNATTAITTAYVSSDSINILKDGAIFWSLLNVATNSGSINTFHINNVLETSVFSLNSIGNVSIAGSLGVTSDLEVNTDKFTVSGTNGNTVIAGTLDVDGAADFDSTADFASNVGITGVLNNVGGIKLLDNSTEKFSVAATTGNTAIAGTLGVTGALTTTGLSNLNGGIAVDTNKFTVAGDNTGNTIIGGTLGVSFATTLGSTLGVTGNITHSTAIFNGHEANFKGGLSVGGTTGLAITHTLSPYSASLVVHKDIWIGNNQTNQSESARIRFTEKTGSSTGNDNDFRGGYLHLDGNTTSGATFNVGVNHHSSAGTSSHDIDVISIDRATAKSTFKKETQFNDNATIGIDVNNEKKLTVYGDIDFSDDLILNGTPVFGDTTGEWKHTYIDTGIANNKIIKASAALTAGQYLEVTATGVKSVSSVGKITVTDNNANSNYDVTFTNGSSALLEDNGQFYYNPSTGTLRVPHLTVNGTTTTINSVQMQAQNAIVFEGATANEFETTLSIEDPTEDRTITLPNATGTIALTDSITDIWTANTNTTAFYSGAITSSGDLTIKNSSTDKFTVASATGNTIISGSLAVGTTLGVTGLTSLVNVLISGTIGVTGLTSVGELGATGLASLNGGINVDNKFIVLGDGTGNAAALGTFTATGLSYLNGGINVNTNKFIVSAAGDVTVTGALTTTGLSNLNGGIAVDTDNFTVNGTTGTVSIGSGSLNVHNGINVRTDKFTVAGATGNTLIEGTLGVTGLTSLVNLTTTGIANLNGGIAVDTDGFTVADGTGNTVIAGTLDVGSTTTINGGNLKLSRAEDDTKHEIISYSDANSLWINSPTTSKLVLATGLDWDTGVSFAYTPGTTGAAAGVLNIGQVNKNNANYTHGITNLYTNGVSRVSIASNGTVTFSNTTSFTGTSLFQASGLTSAGLANLDGGIAVDTDNFTVNGTTGNVATLGTVLIKNDGSAFQVQDAAGTPTLSIIGATGNVLTAGGLSLAATTFVVSEEGKVTAGEWNGTAIASAYIGSHNHDLSAYLPLTGGTVSGLINLNGGIAVDTNKFTVADGTGNTSIAGTLGVTGNISQTSSEFNGHQGGFNGGLGVSGTTGVSGTRPDPYSASLVVHNTIWVGNTSTNQSESARIRLTESGGTSSAINDFRGGYLHLDGSTTSGATFNIGVNHHSSAGTSSHDIDVISIDRATAKSTFKKETQFNENATIGIDVNNEKTLTVYGDIDFSDDLMITGTPVFGNTAGEWTHTYIDTGIANNKIIKASAALTNNEFLQVTTTGVKSLSPSEFRSAIGAGSSHNHYYTQLGTTATTAAYGNHSHSGYISGNESITLSGDVTGSGATSITCTVANDSHTHDVRYYTASEVAGNFTASSHLVGHVTSGHTHTIANITNVTTFTSNLYQFIVMTGGGSDINYKENIINIEGGFLDKISNINIFRFDWNKFYLNNTGVQNRHEVRNLGFSSQDLEQQIPEVIEEIEFSGRKIKIVKNLALFSVLIKTIQELKQKNDDLEQKVNLIAQHLELAI